MTDITYVPQYQPHLYRDNVDLVSAEGENGFNDQFRLLRKEFGILSDVIKQINEAIQKVGQKPSETLQMSLAPTLIATDSAGWIQHAGFVDKPTTDPTGHSPPTGAHGVMPVDLPDKVTIVSLRVTGKNAGTGNLHIILQRQNIVADTNSPDAIMTVAGSGAPFDATLAPVDPNLAVVHNDQFKYLIIASVDGAQPADVVQLNAFQITYKTPAQQ